MAGKCGLTRKRNFVTNNISTTKVYVFISLLLTILLFLQNYICQRTYSLYNPYILQNMPDVSENIYSSLMNSHAGDLQGNLPFITAHYMWCSAEEKHFDYEHYLSVMSILKIMQPDEILFHYVKMPRKKNTHSASWFDDLQRDVTIFVVDSTPAHGLCKDFLNSEHGLTNTNIERYRHLPMGVFVDNNIVLKDVTRTFVINRLKSTCRGDICIPSRKPPLKRIIIKASVETVDNEDTLETVTCLAIKEPMDYKNSSPCIQIVEKFSVEKIINENNPFGRLARNILFGSENTIKSISSASNPIPLHGHIISEELTMMAYYSIIRAVKVGGLMTVYFHGKYSPTNEMWIKLSKLKAQFVFIEVDFETFPTTSGSRLLYSLNVLLQYGGVVFSENVIWLQPLASNIRNFDAVGAVQSNKFDFRILMAKPGAKFLHGLIPLIYQMTTDTTQRTNDYSIAAYHLYEQQLDTVFVYNSLIETLRCDTSTCLPHPEHLKDPDTVTVFIDVIDSNGNLELDLLNKYILAMKINV